MAHAAPLRAGDPARLGRYRLVGRLGEGGQGAVFLADDGRGSRVAVKVLGLAAMADTVARRRFAGEVDLARQVSSFCIAEVLDADLEGSPPYIVSEYVDGPSLQSAIATDGPRAGGALRRLAVGTVTALAAIHQAGIVHRDFKPHNVVLGTDGPRVVDFGIARLVDATATVSDGVVGSVAYMSPEQITSGEVGPASDLFSWAMTMAYAASGEPPFGRDMLPAVINRILHAEPRLPPLPSDLGAILTACLDKDPRRRPSASAVLMQLIGTNVDTGATTKVRPSGDSSGPPPWALPQPPPDSVARGGNRRSPAEATEPLPDGSEPPGGSGRVTVDDPDRQHASQAAPRPRRRRGLLLGAAGAAVVLVLAVAGFLAFRPGSKGGHGATSSVTAPKVTVVGPVGGLLFHDDFTYRGGWDGYTYNPHAAGDAKTDHGYEIDRGTFAVRADSTEPTNLVESPTPAKIQPGGPIPDVVVTALATLQSDTHGTGDFGLACRDDEDSSNGYAFLLGLDGTVRIGREIKGTYAYVTPEPKQVTPPAIGHPLEIQASCTRAGSGSHVAMWIDGKPIFDLTDPTVFPQTTESQVGLYARTPQSGNGVVAVSWDDFSVYRSAS